MTTISTKLADLSPKPLEPEYRDDRWYYQGFSQYYQTEAFEVYNKDMSEFYRARLSLVLKVLEELTTVCEKEFACEADDDEEVAYPNSNIKFKHFRDARLVLDALKDFR